MIGQTLSHFKFTAKLGEGGMGEVYLAEDSNLGRQVAVKVLPEEVAADPERLGRFEREARSIAALNHPRIVTVYSVEDIDGIHFLTMELVQGRSLDKLLPPGGFDLETLFDLAIQIADGLAATHEKGITHRDLKPANVMVTEEGGVKILDFGLAKLAAESEVDDARTALLTQEGSFLGTPHYMSPEQIEGRSVDSRSDVFSLGVMLYEMVTGQRPFRGETPASVISAVLRDVPPSITELKADLPNHLGRIIRRCLEKKPERRYGSARDVKIELEELQKELRAPGAEPDRAAPEPHSPDVATVARRRLRAVLVAGGVLGALAVGLLAGWRLAGSAEAEPPRVKTLTVSGYDREPAASPDGSLVAFTSSRDGRPRIWIKQLATGNEEPVTVGPDSRPRFSPDGSTLLFARDEGDVLSIYRQALVGGQARKVIDRASEADWSPDGSRIAFTRALVIEGSFVTRLGLTDAQGGSERMLLEVPNLLATPRWSPDGSILAVAQRMPLTTGESEFLLVDTETGQVERFGLTSGGQLSNIAWVGDRDLVYARSTTRAGDQADPLSRLLAYSFDSRRERTLFWVEDLFPFIGQQLDATVLDVLDSDSLVFHDTSTRQSLREVTLEGAGERLLTQSEGIDRQPTYTPDGRQVLFSSNRSGNLDIWRIDLATGELRQLTDDPNQDYDPALSPDGLQLIWTSDRSGNFEVWIGNLDGSGAHQLSGDGYDAENPTMTPDGDWIVYWSGNPESLGVWKIRPDGSDLTRIAAGQFSNTEVSPDGRYVAYLAQRPDNLETLILVSEIETPTTVPFEVRVAAPLGTENIIFGRCRWSLDGRKLVFVGVDENGRIGVFDQDFTPGEDTTATRRPLAGFQSDSFVESFGISPDGKKLTLAMLDYTWRLKLADGVRLGRR